MFRLLSIWLMFAACLAVVLGAIGWISVAAVRSDRAESEARQQATAEENVRLALWRIDTALTPLLAQESARPYFVYDAFFPPDRSYSRMFNGDVNADRESLIPSPLLRDGPAEVSLHFQFGPDGQLTSPEAPTGRLEKLAVPKFATQKQVDEARGRLDELAKGLDYGTLAARLPKHEAPPVELVVPPVRPPEQRLVGPQRRSDQQKLGQAEYEYDLRNQAVSNNVKNTFAQSQQQQQFAGPAASPPATDVSGVLMTPLWIDGRLVLARRITAAGRQYVQGCLLDWPAVKASLLDTIADLLPGADLQPVDGTVPFAAGDESRMLAALPVRLVPLAVGRPYDWAASPIVLSLAVAWACVLVAAVAVAGLLWGVVRLSERRAAFVSAVTHELRTPLTTFQMYAEMLAEGMVPDPQQQKQYLQTLQTEAGRLTHLVENVLTYARLERGRRNGPNEPVALGDFLRGVEGRLAARAQQAGMTLATEGLDEYGAIAMRANPSAVEQVLLNLVDNACKYASAAADKRIHLAVRSDGDVAEILVRDHGPGVSAAFRRRLFRSFSKSAQEAAHSAPGIGLGLALSRRLARDLGGNLRFDPAVLDGACFILSLPAVHPGARL